MDGGPLANFEEGFRNLVLAYASCCIFGLRRLLIRRFRESTHPSRSPLETNNLSEKLAGAAGFEPANGGTKSRCLTAWRRPILPCWLPDL